MKTVLGFIALVFFALPVAVAAYLVGGTMWVLGYIDASTVGNAILLGAAAKIAALYEGTAVSYASVQEQDFVLGWKAFLDGTIANLKTTFGITVDGKGWLGPFLGAVGAKLANYASATPTAG